MSLNIRKLVLIFFAISFQLFACLNVSFLNKYLEIFNNPDAFFVKKLDLTNWIIVTVMARALGAYAIGKYAEKKGVFKAILFVAKAFVFVSVLSAVFCLFLEISEEIRYGLYYVRFLYNLLEPVAFVLPLLYICDHCSHLSRFRLSAVFLVSMFIAKLASYFLVEIPSNFIKFWYVIPFLTTLVANKMYNYIAKSVDLRKEKHVIVDFMPLNIKVFLTFLGASCAAGLFYHHFFGSYYSLNVKIVDVSADLGSVAFYFLCALFFFPAARLCEKYSQYKLILLSLAMLFFLSVVSVFVTLDSVVYIYQQILFSFFSSLLIVPSLVVLYQLYKEYSNIAGVLFYFSLGFGLCTALARLEQEFGLQKGMGWCVYGISFVSCFLVIYKYRLTTTFAKKCGVSSSF